MKVQLIIFLLLTSTYSLFAQQGRHRMEQRIKERKIQFITETLALSAEDSMNFWKVYNEYEGERLENRRKLVGLRKGMLAKSDAQLKSDLETMLTLREEEVQIEKKYVDRFLEVITIRQVAALYQAESEFKRVVLEKFREGRGGGGRGRF